MVTLQLTQEHVIDRWLTIEGGGLVTLQAASNKRLFDVREQNVGLEVVHEENLRHHYALTLRDWCRYLVEHWDEAVEEVGLPTAKVWGLYMAGSRVGFETNVIQLHQVLAVKVDALGNDGGLPLRPWWTP